MEPGDVVELRRGTFGLQAPLLLGVLLHRQRKGKTVRWQVLTVRGQVSLDPERAFTRRELQVRLDTSLPPAELQRRLQALGPELLADGSGGGSEKPVLRSGIGALPTDDPLAAEASFWKALVRTLPHDATLTVEELLAAAEVAGMTLGREQLLEVLRGCRGAGMGHFRHRGGRPERWALLSEQDVAAITAHLQRLNQLRHRLVRTVEEVDERGREVTRLVGVAPAQAALTPPLQEELALVASAMARLLVSEQWPGRGSDLDPPSRSGDGQPELGADPDRDSVPGLGGTDTVALGGFHLGSYCRNLAVDWAGLPRSVGNGAMVEFLLQCGLRTVPQVLLLLARRLVVAAPHLRWAYPESAVRESQRLPPLVAAPAEELRQRWDLRSQACFTIDPPTAADFDDAVTVEVHDGGGATLWVHIADVGHYVTPGSPLDIEARRRGSSVYLSTGVLPMLPPALSEDLCSLRGGVDRLAFSVKMELDGGGTVVGVVAGPSVIHVEANLAYPQVDAAIAAGQEPFATYRRWADKMASHRRGLPIETAELRVLLHPQGTELTRKGATAATSMIEVFMVAANEAVATLLQQAKVPALYRCHPLPDRVAAASLNRQLAVLGLEGALELPRPQLGGGGDGDDEHAAGADDRLLSMLRSGGKVSLGAVPTSAAEGVGGDAAADRPAVAGLAQLTPQLQEQYLRAVRSVVQAVGTIEDPAVAEVATLKVLSAIGRAFYSAANLGHFGLGSTSYCHFTSPIRRYPDLVVHRQLRWLLQCPPHELPLRAAAAADGGGPPHTAEELGPLASELTAAGVAAERLERDLLGSALTLLEGTQQEQTLEGVVAAITRGGVYLLLRDGREVSIPPWELGGRLHIDEDQSLLLREPLDPSRRPSPAELRALAAAMVGGPSGALVQDGSGPVPLTPVLRLGQVLQVQPTGRDIVAGRRFVRPRDPLGSAALGAGAAVPTPGASEDGPTGRRR